MKRKFIAVFSSLVVFFSSTISCYANPLVLPLIAPELLATLATVLVGCGVQLTSNDDIYTVGRVFSDKNRDNWDSVINTFKKDVSIGANGVVRVGSSFLDVCKQTFDPYYNETVYDEEMPKSLTTLAGLPVYPYNSVKATSYDKVPTFNYVFSDYMEDYKMYSSVVQHRYLYSGGQTYISVKIPSVNMTGRICYDFTGTCDKYYSIKYIFERDYASSSKVNLVGIAKARRDRNKEDFVGRGMVIEGIPISSLGLVSTLPLSKNYSWDNINDNIDVDSGTVGLYVPGNAGSLPGVVSGDVIANPGVSNPPYELPKDGTVSFPNVSNPSIDIGDSITIPGDVAIDKPIDKPVDIPSEGLWTAISDFIVSLVVPNESYWVDTFNGFRNKLSSKFPGLDVSSLDGLCVNGLPLQDVKVSLMGTGSAVAFSGSTINSIASWLKPIVQGFIGVFLILYNYNQIYYLLRGTKPISLGRQGGSD